MNQEMFPWVKTPEEVADQVTEMIDTWTEEVEKLRAEEEQRASAQQLLRRIMRVAFMSHHAATEEDFERCWPRLRDDLLCEHAASVFNEIFGEEEEDDWTDYGEYDEDEEDDDFGGGGFDTNNRN